MDLTPGLAEDQERSEEPMYVVVEFHPLEPEKFRRKVLFVRPLSRADAEDLADNQRDIAKFGGRHDDTYEVYELCKPGDREAARRAGREDAAKAIEAEAGDEAQRTRRTCCSHAIETWLRECAGIARGEHNTERGSE